MKKIIVWFFVVGYCLLPVWIRIPEPVGEYLAVFFVFAPLGLLGLYVFIAMMFEEPTGYVRRRYTQRDLDDARHEGIQQGRRG